MNQTFTYKKTNETELKAELFSIDEPNAPLILYIHGGGLIWGTRKDMNSEQIKLYQEHGYHVLSIAYRLAPETKLPSIISDVADALRWVKEELPNHLDFNENKVIAIGSSAGGYLALMSGIFKTKPNAIVSFYGYGNILGEWYASPSAHFNKMTQVNETLVNQLIQPKEVAEAPITSRYAIYLYCRQQGNWLDYVGESTMTKEDHQAYCPIFQVDSDYPPTMLLHGDQDEDVPYEESVQMHEALNKASVETKLITIPNGKHQFDEKMDDALVKDAFSQVIDFLNQI